MIVNTMPREDVRKRRRQTWRRVSNQPWRYWKAYALGGLIPLLSYAAVAGNLNLASVATASLSCEPPTSLRNQSKRFHESESRDVHSGSLRTGTRRQLQVRTWWEAARLVGGETKFQSALFLRRAERRKLRALKSEAVARRWHDRGLSAALRRSVEVTATAEGLAVSASDGSSDRATLFAWAVAEAITRTADGRSSTPERRFVVTSLTEAAPTRGLGVAGAFGISVVSILTAFASAWFSERYATRFKSVVEVEETLHAVVTAEFPARVRNDRRCVRRHEHETKKLVDHLVQVSEDCDLRSVCITSTERGEGRTQLVYRVAQELSRRRYRVIVVDADVSHPALHDHFNTAIEFGFTELVAHAAGSDGERWELTRRALTRTAMPNVRLICAGGISFLQPKYLTRNQLRPFFLELRRQADFVLCDTPALSDHPASIACARSTEATLLVVEPGTTNRMRAVWARTRLLEAKAQLEGIVINHTRRRLWWHGDERPPAAKPTRAATRHRRTAAVPGRKEAERA